MRDRRLPYIKELLLFGPHTMQDRLCGQDGVCATQLPGTTMMGEQFGQRSISAKNMLENRSRIIGVRSQLPGVENRGQVSITWEIGPRPDPIYQDDASSRESQTGATTLKPIINSMFVW